ncbi:type I toxin-antitoxin system SymE family toxin [Enterobacter sp. BIGb0383]|uniref:type I toxin-antitoxin system SymE family toxin n=1 Tax=Enterobacter sp. BIGb0383 TaxID=2485118 RepID=UPI0021A5809B|nr:type I toxin-antitoxin system SymE family toxin [Enterobacter sp. BIGb0383]
MEQAGFIDGMPLKIRVMPDCIITTTQYTRELYGCAEGPDVAYIHQPKMKQWQEKFPRALNDTGNLSVYRCGNRHFA